MKFFRYPIDRIPIGIIALVFAVDLTVYGFVDDWRWLIIYAVLLWFPKINISAWNHHHQHCPTFYQPSLNWVLDFVFGFLTGVTSKGWVLHHNLGHHLTYLDQTQDEAAWKTKSGKTMSPIQYMVNVAGTRYYRSFRVGLRHRKHLNVFVVTLMLQFLVLVGLFLLKPVHTLLIFINPMMSGLLITSLVNHNQHAGLDTQNEFEASRNKLDPSLNLLTGNLGYHTAHHLAQALHWSKLPAYHQTIAHRIPAHCYSEVGFPFRQLTHVLDLKSKVEPARSPIPQA